MQSDHWYQWQWENRVDEMPCGTYLNQTTARLFMTVRISQMMNDEERKELRQQIGMLFQGSALFDSMTVEQNMMFPLDMFTK